MSSKLVIGVAGMPGAGKSIVSKVASELGCKVVIMGDVVREEAKRMGLEPSPANIGRVMLELREREGAQVVANRCIPSIETSETKGVIVDGLRSLEEVEVFRLKYPGFKILCVHSSPETRFRRLFGRGRSDDPRSWNVFVERDRRELEVGIGSVIALADLMIINEGTKKQLEDRVRHLIKRAIFL
ncbi:MAG: AAA family ATPase [Nitrososphaerota archaeon]